jgi:hypothetical protein
MLRNSMFINHNLPFIESHDVFGIFNNTKFIVLNIE